LTHRVTAGMPHGVSPTLKKKIWDEWSERRASCLRDAVAMFVRRKKMCGEVTKCVVNNLY